MIQRPAAVLPLLAFVSIAGADVSYRMVALTGTPPPGMPGVTYKFLTDARINSSGKVVFWAELAGTGVTADNDGSLWLNQANGTTLVIREGSAVPGVPDSVFASMPRPVITDSDVIVFPGIVAPAATPATSNNLAIVRVDGGPTLLAREGEAAPGIGANYSGLSTGAVTPDGSAVWQGNAGRAVWTAAPGGAGGVLVARGDAAPGAGTATFDYIDAPGTSGASMIFRATTIAPPNPPGTPGMGVWLASGAAPTLVALAGAPAPGLPAGVTFAQMNSGPMACAGDCVAFAAQVAGTGVTTANDLALFSGASAAPALLAREGNPSPVEGATYGTLASPPALFSAGAVAFVTTLSGAAVTSANNSALFVHDASGTRVVMREGDAAPGLAGVSIDFFGPPVIDASGRVAVVAGLRGAVTSATNSALLVADPAGGVSVLLRTGAPFDSGVGVRTIEEIMLESEPAMENGSAMVSLGAASRLVLKLHFKDVSGGATVRSSGLFVATIGGSVACYPNCDGSTAQPILNVLDFNCFLNRFTAGESYANCDGSTAPPVLTVLDFNCFLNRFTAGCR